MGCEHSHCRCTGDGVLAVASQPNPALESPEIALDLTDSFPKSTEIPPVRFSLIKANTSCEKVFANSEGQDTLPSSTTIVESAGFCLQSSEEAPKESTLDSGESTTFSDSGTPSSVSNLRRISMSTASVPSGWLHQIIEKTGQIENVYEFSGILGEGSFGKVRKAVGKSTGVVRAVKSIPKKAAQSDSIKNEIEISKIVDHPHIIKLYEIFENDDVISLVLECCLGGNLDQLVDYRKTCNENQAAEIMQQILAGVQYMHNTCICHRDLKPDNVLVEATHPLSLKITDFGLSCVFEPGKLMTKEIVGTARTMAPEVIKGKYTHVCDVWSCGVIMYFVLCGYFPFMADTSEEVLKKVAKGSYAFETVEWVDVSEATMDFIGLLMNKAHKTRCTAEQALNHDWFGMYLPKAKSKEEVYQFSILR